MIRAQFVDLKMFSIEKKLGEGSFGTVYLVVEIKTGQKFAAKVSKKDFVEADNQIEFLQELVAISKSKYPATLSLKGYSLTNFEGEPYPTIITPYMPNGSLLDLLKNNPNFPSSKKYIILLGIAKGMKYLHSISIIHRDLKPANIFLDDKYYPRVGDFGESEFSKLEKSEIRMESIKGTPLYCAPEIFLGKVYSYKIDIYSFSIIAYELITSQAPFKNITSIHNFRREIIHGKRPDLSIIEDDGIKDFLSRCWSHDESKRPDFDQIVEELQSKRFIEYMKAVPSEVDEYLQLFDERLEIGKPSFDDTNSIRQLEDRELVQYIKSMADEGIPVFINIYGYILEHGNMYGIEINDAEAARYYKMAADKGDSDGMHNYGCMAYSGKGVAKNMREALHYFKMAAEKDHLLAMSRYASMLSEGEGGQIPIDQAKAAFYYKKAADKGCPVSMNNYGKMLFEGKGVHVNKREATNYFKMAAEKGNADAMYNYAHVLAEGIGVPVNKEEAARYCKKAADEGHIDAMYSYANMLDEGIGVSINKEGAAQYFKMAAEHNNPEAMYNYALMLAEGDGIPVNKEEAARYFKMAADKGKPNAMYNYAVMLAEGDGIPVNKEEADRYFKMAEDKSNEAKNI